VQPTAEPDDPLSRFSIAVFTLNGLLMRNGDRITRPLRQSSARWQVLGRAGYQPQTVAQMARDMGQARQSVQRIADVLAGDGLVRYKDHPDDRRTKLIELTARGAKTLAAIYANYGKWSDHIMTRLSASKLESVADALEDIAAVLASDINGNTSPER
jgi:DNA-binding MarR family transcriptional regulator